VTSRRPEDFDLARAVRDRGFTPRRGDRAALVALLAHPDRAVVRGAARGLLSLGPACVPPVAARARDTSATPDERVAALRVLGAAGAAGLLRDPEAAWHARTAFVEVLAEPGGDGRVRRAAARAGARSGDACVAEAIVARAEAQDVDEAEARALFEALGVIGATTGCEAAAREAVARLARRVGSELARLRAAQALRRLERDALRSTTTTALRLDVPASAPLRVLLGCDRGLEDVMANEARARGCVDVQIDGPGRVRCVWPAGSTLGRIGEHACARDLAFVVGPVDVSFDVPSTVVALLDVASRDDGPLAPAWTSGPRRFRLAWATGGHRRADTRAVSLALAASGAKIGDVAAASPLVDDPRGSPWEVRVVEEPAGDAYSAPRNQPSGRKGPDARPRRTWLHIAPRAALRARSADRGGRPEERVQGASHAAVAAALARLGAPRDDDVVWDPFCGSGTELIACGSLGARTLVGTDVDGNAIALARGRLARAAMQASLYVADACTFVPVTPPTLVVTNPPLGRRVGRQAGPGEGRHAGGSDPHPAALLERFAHHAARVLAPGARLVWLSPSGERTARALETAGFRLTDRRRVDLGGIVVERQVAVLARPMARRAPSHEPSRQRRPRFGAVSGFRATKR
jgi:hypothetical protein